jgi:flagellar basal-body rod protein FlgB
MEPVQRSTLAMVERALDAAALRHQAIAHNIANLNSAAYVPLGVSFDAQLASAGAAPRLVPEPGAVPGPRPQDMDLEMVKLSQNTLHYEALLRAVGLQFSILGDAMGAGGRS